MNDRTKYIKKKKLAVQLSPSNVRPKMAKLCANVIDNTLNNYSKTHLKNHFVYNLNFRYCILQRREYKRSVMFTAGILRVTKDLLIFHWCFFFFRFSANPFSTVVNPLHSFHLKMCDWTKRYRVFLNLVGTTYYIFRVCTIQNKNNQRFQKRY